MISAGCRRIDGSAWFFGDVNDFCRRPSGFRTEEAAGTGQITRQRYQGVQKATDELNPAGKTRSRTFRPVQRCQEETCTTWARISRAIFTNISTAEPKDHNDHTTPAVRTRDALKLRHRSSCNRIRSTRKNTRNAGRDRSRTRRKQELSGQMSFLDHLEELRKRIINSLIAIAVAFGVCWWFADTCSRLVSRADRPKRASVPCRLHAYRGFNLELKLAFMAAIFLSAPVYLGPGLALYCSRTLQA